MTHIELRMFPKAKRAGRKPKGVTVKRLTTHTGEKVTVRAIDANSESFSEDLLYVFSRNVDAARDENKAIIGSRDGVRKAP